MAVDTTSEKHVSVPNVNSNHAHYTEGALQRTASGVILVPQPSNDRNDPLNWSLTKKITTLIIVSGASCFGIAQSLASQSSFFIQAELYDKTPVQLSYGAAAAIVGLATGPVLIWAPLSRIIGRPSCILWGTLLSLGMNVWAAEMIGQDDYVPFVISKWLAATFGSVATAIGAGTLLDIFFLHQRGKAFAFYGTASLFGTLFGPTFSGFIDYSAPWPVQFWWCVGVEGLIILLAFVFLEETGTSRKYKQERLPDYKSSWLANRWATFFPGHKVAPPWTLYTGSPLCSLMIGVCPVTLLAGGSLCIAFGWAVAVVNLLPIYLQSPVAEGGYGFSPLQTAAFTFASWVGGISAQTYGTLLNDRIPLWLCRRRGGVWKPEYRLYPLLLPFAILVPIGLGIFGAALQYHLHYMVLALGYFLITFADFGMLPIMVNYVAESFTDYAAEAATIMNFYRLMLGLAVPFFESPWRNAVGAGWQFGMMAFFTLLAFSMTGLLAWKGPLIRKYSFVRLRRSEEGTTLLIEPVDGHDHAAEADTA